MVSGIPLIAVVSCLYIYSGIGAVNINVTSPITAALYQPEVTLPCRYSLDHPDGKNIIAWSVNKEYILKRDSDGTLHYSDSYTGRVHLSDGCSLVLKNPNLNDTGDYTVSIVEASHKQVTAVVNLVVTLQSTTVKKETEPVLAETSTHKEYDTTSENSGTSLERERGRIALIVVALLILNVIHAYLFLTQNNVFSRQKDESELERKIRQYHVIVSNLLPVLITAVVVNTVFFDVVWNTPAQKAVGIWMGILSAIIIVVFLMKCRVKKKLQ